MGCICCKTSRFLHDPLPVKETVQYFSFQQNIEYVVPYYIRNYIELNDKIEIKIIPSSIQSMIIDYITKDNIDSKLLNTDQTATLFNLIQDRIPNLNKNRANLYENVVVNPQNLKLKLLYRASRDGWSYHTFHSKCDDIGQTLIICGIWHYSRNKSLYSDINTLNYEIIGGYTSIPWSQYGGYHKDTKSFLFYMNHDGKTKIVSNIKDNHYDKAVHHSSNQGPRFGENDLIIDHSHNNIEIYAGSYLPLYYKNSIETLSDYEVFYVY